MSVRVISLLCPLVAALIGTAHALVPDGHNVTQAEPNRIRVTHPQAQNLLRRQDAWRAFTEGDGAGWMARFDEATGTPHRAWGPGGRLTLWLWRPNLKRWSRTARASCN